MKKLLSIVLAIVVVLSLAACSPDNTLTEEKLKGTWALELNVADLMAVAGDELSEAMGLGDMGNAFDKLPDNLTLTALYVFDGAGKCTVMIEKDSIEAFFKSIVDALLTEETMYGIFEMQGMDKAAVDAALATQGTSMAALIEMTKQQMQNMDFTESMGTVKGDYIVSDEEIEYTIEGNRVTSDTSTLEYDGTNLLMIEVTTEDEDSPDISSLLPLTIKRVSDKTDY